MIRLRSTRAIAALMAGLVATAPALAETKADILSIGGAVTEIIVALGQQDRLKARDTTSSYPPEIAELPDVGYMRALSPEGVLSVDPALIITGEGAGPPEALDVIRAADVELVEVPDARDADGILRKIEIIGAALGVPDRAEALGGEVGAALADATRSAKRPEAGKKRVLFILSTQGGRVTASGAGTEADAIIRMAGGLNAVMDFEGYRQMTDEAVGGAAPDVILMMDRGGDHGISDEDLLAMPAISLTPAARTRSVIRMDGLLLLGFGPRTAEAVTQLSRAVYDSGS
ncbi:heme/hemin ABC transporter substrate-binding protein [Roseovarius nanhaiticus]|uniref:heme/hemin ABC transporter substrate-binding protein n=1 Tax=Roseovarius nanhaiticus TaxID=573024 RepID=UPI00248FD9E3|nr:ABC transporter substrate-binding protein [Roseovarius nanhaiticus]